MLDLDPGFAGAIHNRALSLQALGRHAEALAGYEQLLAIAPEHAPAHYGYGLAQASLNRPAEALASYQRTLELDPGFAEARLRIGQARRALGEAEAALREFGQLLAADPAHAEALFEHGSALQALDRHQEALASYDRALAARPSFAEACNNRALVLLALGRPAEAVAACEQAILLQPAFAEAHANRGLALSALHGRLDEALASFDRALALRPAYAEAHANRGHVLQELRRLPAALAAYERAQEIEPRKPEYLYGRGAVLQLMERHQEAVACYDRALAVDPRHTTSLLNRGGALRALRRPVEAAATFARLLDIDPDFSYADGNCLHARLHACDWEEFAAARARIESGVAAGRLVDMPFQFLAISASAAAQRRCAALYAADIRREAVPLWRGARYGHRRIRLAYVSGDFGFHPVSYLMAELFESHDRNRFEVYAVSLRAPGSAPFDVRVRAAFEHFIDASAMSDLEVARAMHAHEIDIAVDLAGYTDMPRAGIYAYRPAPVHAAYLGYAGTLDNGCIDYLVADPVAIPPAAAGHYGEQVVRLPGSFMPRDTSLVPAPAPRRAAAGLPEQGFVFCCFNNAYKLNPPMFGVWMGLLAAVPGSVLWLTDLGEPAHAHLRREAAARGIDPVRLVFAAKTGAIEEHLGRLVLADLFLDTLPYNAHTTASDALWAGVPVLTCAGEAFASRVAASLLVAAGLPGLVTSSLEEYEALALALVADRARLAGLRQHLLQRRAGGSLFNTKRLRLQLEDAYLHMYQRSDQGLAPAAFEVPG